MKKGLAIALISAGVVVSAGAVTAMVVLSDPPEHVCEAGDWVVDTEPTCVEEGKKHRACVQCGQVLEECPIEALGHSISDWIVDEEATYTSTGLRHKECVRCGEVLVAEGIPMIGHTCTYSEWETVTEPTCTQGGKRRHTCTACGLVQEEIINKLGHLCVHHEAAEATCTQPGHSEYWYCDRCDTYFADSACKVKINIADTFQVPLGHEASYTAAAEPDCLHDGHTDYWYCGRCHTYFADEALTLELPEETIVKKAIGHSLEHHGEVQATCTENGSIEYWYCSRCHQYFSDASATVSVSAEATVVPATGHSTYKTNSVTATCTVNGNIEYWTCGTCHKIFREPSCTTEISEADTVIEALGHMTVRHAAVEPTCEQNGSKEYWTCSRCNGVFSSENCLSAITLLSTTVGSLGHHYQNGECTHCHEAEPAAYTRNGTAVTFGSYPQSRMTEASLVSKLNFLAGAVPTQGQASRGNWTSYGYYYSYHYTNYPTEGYHVYKHYMWYQDVYCDAGRYRGVYFTDYRLSGQQQTNGYTAGTIYWFKWEPLTWTILSDEGGAYFLFSAAVIDANDYDIEMTVDYGASSIRNWLNSTFYGQAFQDSQKGHIKTALVTNGLSSMVPRGENNIRYEHCFDDTQDKIFLMSAEELTNAAYSFGLYNQSDPHRQPAVSDYALAQGLNYYRGAYSWWTRSASYWTLDEYATYVNQQGQLTGWAQTRNSSLGIVPALWMNK